IRRWANRSRPLPLFFQAEHGRRDALVTGVQTCALPIYPQLLDHPADLVERLPCRRARGRLGEQVPVLPLDVPDRVKLLAVAGREIGRAACRERVLAWGGGGRLRQTTRGPTGAQSRACTA